ncbi:MAG: gliding motility-associated C-terminal domain-containing protein [Saprospiraceae bacterium]
MKITTLTVLTFLLCTSLQAQQTLTYQLSNSFSPQEAGNPNLLPLANNSNQTGNFQTIPLPANFCPNGGEMSAYRFEDNAGFAFDNSNGFIDCEYTIELIYKFDDTPGLFDSPWVFIFGFEPNQDSGLFYEFNPLFGTTFDVWRDNFNPAAEPCPINTNDWQKLTVVRYCNGIVQFYKECEILFTYDDSVNNILLADEDQIIFFQDDPSIIMAESQPGFVRNLKISNFAMTPEQINTCCDNICDDLEDNCTTEIFLTETSCDGSTIGTDTLIIFNDLCDSIIITNTTLLPSDNTELFETTCNPEDVGITIQELTNIYGCDSTVTNNTVFEEAPIFEYNLISCVPESGGTDSLFYDCDSIVIVNVNEAIIDTLFFPAISVSAGSTVTIFGNEVNQPGLYCETLSSVDGCDSTNCQMVEWLVSTSEPLPESGYYIPNVFSPNGDGINDYFTIFASERSNHIFSLQIYDRAGILIFERDNLLSGFEELGWDGNVYGQRSASGIYVYVIQSKSWNEGKTITGTVTLLR